MSCVEVMYQPYAAYFPYHQRSSNDEPKKFGVQKMHEPLDSGSYSGGSGASSTVTKEEEGPEKETLQQPQDTQYIGANCVLLTYFSGDTSSVVDEHFSRALSQPSSYSAESQASKQSTWKDISPMAQRNFPPSFWNSAYQPSTSLASAHHDLSLSDPYMPSPSLHGMSSLHQDPWHYSLSSQAHSYSHRSSLDLAYSSMASTSRFNPHYSSLLMQPSIRAGRLPGQCDISKTESAWGTTYHPTDALRSDLTTHAHLDSHTGISARQGLDAPAVQESSNLWF